MIFEVIFKEIGDFGRGQIIQYFLLCWPFLLSGFLSTDVIFFMAVPDFVCRPDNNSINDLGTILNTSSESKIAETLVSIQNSVGNYKNSRCHSWNSSIDFVELLSTYTSRNTSSTNWLHRNVTINSKCLNGFIYNKQDYGSTAPTEYDLVCEFDYVRSNLKTLVFVGRIVGAILFGPLSDTIGRLYTFLIVVAFNLVSGIGLYFSMNPIMIGFFLLIQGLTQVGYTITTFVLGGEMVGISKRKYTGTILLIFGSVAFVLIPLFHWIIKNWRYLALWSGLPSIIFFLYIFCVYESPRWLLTKGRTEEALKIIEKVAKLNKVTLSEELKSQILNHTESKEYKKEADKDHSMLALINTKSMCLLSLNIWFNWMINNMIYIGIIFNVENLAGSLYLNFILLGIAEIPSAVFNLLLLDRIGRRNLLIISLWITSGACFVVGCIPKNNTLIITLIAMVGKLSVTMSYGVIYFYSSELFPTPVRNAGVGISSMSGKIGSTLATLILVLHKYYSGLPMIIFAILGTIAGALTFHMPETKGKPLDQDFRKEMIYHEKLLSNEDPEKLVNEEKI